KYFGDHDLAMESTQKTFISMYKSISGLQEIEKFTPWLYRIARNHCHDEERSKSRKWTVSYGEENGEDDRVREIHDREPDPYKKMHEKDICVLMEQALVLLTPEQREVLIMKEYEGLKFREIAEILEISENTVKSRLYYGLTHLKKILSEKNFNIEMMYYE
ncbi:MAG: RNA polymerase sigma factor, partial [Cyclobacteriaceae bacterium]|nr:RNA polymerase sigma factor [Cyclobacteriaceae bacterium]